jgi:hypothetical protein
VKAEKRLKRSLMAAAVEAIVWGEREESKKRRKEGRDIEEFGKESSD